MREPRTSQPSIPCALTEGRPRSAIPAKTRRRDLARMRPARAGQCECAQTLADPQADPGFPKGVPPAVGSGAMTGEVEDCALCGQPKTA